MKLLKSKFRKVVHKNVILYILKKYIYNDLTNYYDQFHGYNCYVLCIPTKQYKQFDSTVACLLDGTTWANLHSLHASVNVGWFLTPWHCSFIAPHFEDSEHYSLTTPPKRECIFGDVLTQSCNHYSLALVKHQTPFPTNFIALNISLKKYIHHTHY